MKYKNNWIWGFAYLTILVVLSACGSPASETQDVEEGGTIPDSISCEVYYRPTAGRSLDGSILNLSTDGDRGSLDFDHMRFEAVFLSDDVGEGKSLSITVSDLDSGSEISRSLYQLDQGKGLRDQFIGGHGFTGLAYVFHPASSAEMQYFCQAG